MKITGVEPILIAVPYEHGGPKPMRPSGPWSHMETLLVRLDTDAGITGWGEAFGFAASPLTREAIIRAVAPLCIGRDFNGDVGAFITELARKLHAMAATGRSASRSPASTSRCGISPARRKVYLSIACSAARRGTAFRPTRAFCATVKATSSRAIPKKLSPAAIRR